MKLGNFYHGFFDGQVRNTQALRRKLEFENERRAFYDMLSYSSKSGESRQFQFYMAGILALVLGGA